MKKLLMFGVLGVGLIGCSTAPVTTSTAKVVSSDRVYKNEYFKRQSNEQAEVTFLRDKGHMGSGCSHDIFANNSKIFSIRSNEHATIYLKPDYYIFRLETGGGLCPNIAISQEAELKPNTNAEYRILIPSDNTLRFTRIK